MRKIVCFSGILCSVPMAGWAEDRPVTGKRAAEKVTVVGRPTSYTAPALTIFGKVPVALRDIPQSVSVITQQRMQDQNVLTLSDALSRVNGIVAQPNDVTNSRYYARGYSLNQTTDGTPSYGAIGNGNTSFDLAIYDRVEVLRGSAGLLQGSGDPGGVVNLVTKKPGDTWAISGTAMAGSWENYRGTLDVSVPLNTSRTLKARIVSVLQDQNFFYNRSHDRKWLAYGVLEWDIRPDTVFTVSHGAQRENLGGSYPGLPSWSDTGGLLSGGYRGVNPVPDWIRNRLMTQETLLTVRHTINDRWNLTVRGTIRDQSAGVWDVFGWSGLDPLKKTMTFAAQRNIESTYNWRAADAYLSGSERWLSRTHHFLFGLNYDSYDFREGYGRGPQFSPDISIFDPVIPQMNISRTAGDMSSTVQKGVYGQARLQVFQPLYLILGGRASWFETRQRNAAPSPETPWKTTQRANGKLTPYLGTVLHLGQHVSAYGSYSSIFIPQSGTMYGGGTLSARTGAQVETGLKGEFYNGRLNVSAALFSMRDRNRSLSDLMHRGYYLNAGLIRTKGWEAQIDGMILSGWNISAGYTYVDISFANPRDSSYGGTATPRHSLKVWSNYSFLSGPLKGLSLGGGLNAQSSFQSPAFNIRTSSGLVRHVNVQPGYATIDAEIGYRMNQHYRVQLNMTNLTDQHYFTRLGMDNSYNMFGIPRSFIGTIQANY